MTPVLVVAVTVNVYVVPAVSAPTDIGLDAPVAKYPSGKEVTL
jgi:hypothetical protein